MFALIDCNNFYASCERVFRPDLNGKPVVILSNNDGCVIARSNEAKAVGIPMGAPAFKFETLFKQHEVHVFSANFPLYGDMSNRVMDILSEFSPDMEIYSIDECFLKLQGFELYNLQEYGQSMKQKVGKHTGIPICVGIAPTKALAKVANHIAKKFSEHTHGIYCLDSDLKKEKALKWLKIEDVWGIGRNHVKQLQKIGVLTAFDFIKLSDQWVKKNMSVVGLRLKHDLQGIPTLDLEEVQPKKNIATTRSFETNYTQYEELAERVTAFTASCAEKLRKQKSCCNSLMVFIKTNKFSKDLPQYHRSILIKLPFASNSTIELNRFALLALKQIFRNGYQYKKAGVIVQDLVPENQVQTQLFDSHNKRHDLLMKAIDKMNAQFGQQKIRLASQDSKRVWKMKQEKLSPRYTTDLKDIITINLLR